MIAGLTPVATGVLPPAGRSCASCARGIGTSLYGTLARPCASRARYFDPRLSWRGPFGRTKVRPILLPAKLSYHDKKASKETLPGRSPRERRAVPCAPRSTRGLADSASLRCGQRAVPTAPRKISGPDPRRPPVLGELRRGKTDLTPFLPW